MATSYWFMFSLLSVLSFFASCTSNSIPYAGSNQLKFWKENVVNEMPLALVSKLSPMNKIDSEYYTSLVSKKTFCFDAQSCLVADMFCTSQTDALGALLASFKIPDQAKYYATGIPDQAKYYATRIPDQAKYYPSKIPDQAKYYATGIPDQAKYYPSKIPDQAKYYATRIPDQAKYYPSKIPDQAKYYATRIPDQAKYYATRIPDQAKYYPLKIPDQAKYYATGIPDQAKYYPSKIPDQAKYYATRILDQAKYYPSKIPDQAKYYATRIPDQAKYYPSKIPDQAKYYTTRIPDQAKYYPSKIPDQAKYYATRIPDQAMYYPSKIPDQAKYYANSIPDQAKYYPSKIPDQAKYYATRIPDQAKYYPSKIPDQAKYYATSHSNHHLGEVSFFRVSILKPGNTVHLDNLENPFPHRSFLPSQIASKIPINSNHLQHLFPETFSSPFTKDTTQTTIQSCNAPNLKGEVKKCAKSLEEMIEFSKTILKKNHLTALTTKSTEGSGKKLKIDKFHKINAQKSVSCHEIFLPFATYICHLLSSTNIYSVDLVDLKTDAHVNTALVVCHMDTSSWPADHAAFKMLNFSPGKGEACHWMSQSDLIWVGDDVHA
ncbi:hypothetical protein FXO38_32882 [Capsicum annuum]|nr:hypothetical protein FXO38_32882 [Capsicum annuum]